MSKNRILLVSILAIWMTLTLIACNLFELPFSQPEKGMDTEPTPTNTAEKPSSDTPAPSLPDGLSTPTNTAEKPSSDTLAPSLPDELSTPTLEPQLAAPPNFSEGEHIALSSIQMFDANRGWGISGAYILTTEDGGHTWREVTPPEQIPLNVVSEAFGTFLDPQTAWVIFSVDDQIAPSVFVWRTTNGGKTWIPSESLSHQIYGDKMWAEFAVSGTQSVWLMIRGTYVGAGSHYLAELFHTEDGGVTWNSQDGDIGVDYTGLAFADSQTGWLTWQTIGAYTASPPQYAQTQNGGVTWNTHELPPPENAPTLFENYEYCEPYQPNLLSPQRVRLLVGCFKYGFPPKEFVSYLYASNDNGANWQTYLLPENVLASQFTLIYFNSDAGLLLGREIYRTLDGGKTWAHIKTVAWDAQFSFIDSKRGWAIARADNEIALVYTSDGGELWSILDPVTVR